MTGTSDTFWHRMPPRWLLLVLLCLVFMLRARALLTLSHLRDDPDGYAVLADWLWWEGSFGDPWQPTAYRPPLYPLLIALPVRLTPEGSVIGVLHVVLGAITVWAVWRLAPRWQLPPVGALLAAALLAVDPILINQSAEVMTETLATCLAALTLLALARACGDRSLAAQTNAGYLAGLCVLCRPTFLAWLCLSCVAMPFVLSVPRRQSLFHLALFAASAGAAIAPWALRNVWQFNRPIVTTTHGGYTLLLANNPSFYEYLRHGSWGEVWDASDFDDQWQQQIDEHFPRTKYSRLDPPELEADALAYRTAWQNIRDEPAMFAYSCLVRVGRLWSVLPHQLTPDESSSRRGLRYAVAIWYTCELALAAVGLWILRKQMLASPWIWGLLLLVSFTAVHALYWTDMRMRAPLMPVVALLAATSVTVLAQSKRIATRPATATYAPSSTLDPVRRSPL